MSSLVHISGSHQDDQRPRHPRQTPRHLRRRTFLPLYLWPPEQKMRHLRVLRRPHRVRRGSSSDEESVAQLIRHPHLRDPFTPVMRLAEREPATRLGSTRRLHVPLAASAEGISWLGSVQNASWFLPFIDGVAVQATHFAGITITADESRTSQCSFIPVAYDGVRLACLGHSCLGCFCHRVFLSRR